MTPWTAMLREAAGLGITPAAFWRLSLREWRMLVERPGGAAMGRAAFDLLARTWPDETSPLTVDEKGART